MGNIICCATIEKVEEAPADDTHMNEKLARFTASLERSRLSHCFRTLNKGHGRSPLLSMLLNSNNTEWENHFITHRLIANVLR